MERLLLLFLDLSKPIIEHKGYPIDSIVQEYVQYSYNVGGIDLVKLIECENGRRDPSRLGDYGDSYGFCQINRRRHKPPQLFYDDWKGQIDYCNKKLEGGTKFYGPSRIVKGQYCHDAVNNLFYITTKGEKLLLLLLSDYMY